MDISELSYMVAERYRRALEKIKRLEAENARLRLENAALKSRQKTVRPAHVHTARRWPEDY